MQKHNTHQSLDVQHTCMPGMQQDAPPHPPPTEVHMGEVMVHDAKENI